MSSPAPLKLARIAALGLALAVAGLAGLAAAHGAFASRAPPLEVLGQLPAFQLTDQTGKPSGLAELRGKVWVADFVFTRCPGICPMLTERMGKLQQRSARLGTDFSLVSISVDPAYDTPPVLTAYMSAHHADPSRWRFLTGPLGAIESVVTGGFKETLERDAKAGPDDFMSIVHGGHFVLVDRVGRIRGYYDSNELGAVDDLLRDAATLLAE